MSARRLVLVLLALAALAALAARQAGGTVNVPRLAGLLPLAPATVTRPAPTLDSIPAVDLPERAGPAPGAAPTPLAFAVAALAGRPTVPGQARQLGQDGCCYGAWWAEDSQALLVIDQPGGAAQTSVYRLPVWPPGEAAAPADTRIAAEASGQERYRVLPAGGQSTVRDLVTGAEWPLPTGGNPVRVAPDGSRLVWWEGRGGSGPFDHIVRVWGSRIDGSEAKELGSLWGTEVVSFLPDNARVLVTGRPANNSAVAILATLNVETGALVGIARGLWLENALPSPDGRRVVYTTSMNREDPAANGVWLVDVDGGAPVKLPFEGAYRWRDGDRLVYVPLEPGQGSRRLMQYDARTGEAGQLLDPDDVPVRIANNDWSISPDGFTLAWVAEEDRNLWIVDLP